ncbi:MAG: hypothetical protein LRY27_00605 [Chitinophagales bacterium]|nr:hypothetical protein [Chitinophagales bacterium]
MVLLFVYFIIKILRIDYNSALFQPIKFSFKNKINIAIISITIASFLFIGVVTISYFKESYTQNNTDKLIKKQKSVLSSIEYILENNQINEAGILPSNFNTEIAVLADIHGIDLNIFNTKGDLLISSQPGIFGNGLISKKMNPLALYQIISMQNERFNQEEAINNLKFQSVYVPIRLKNGLTYGILNLPYFAQEETLRSELSNLMVALVNVYVLLLIGSIVIAFLISNSITSSLAEISSKLSNINVASKNETIDWKDDDEIGALVKEYNKMIHQIEESAQIMAKSERESAWREMAKQIAHEIKNPLTPMKLSIQHLQRAIKDKRDDVPELASKVSNTLIEQIDNLSEIATAFSSFAKMPTAQKEEVDLNDILQNVVSLFNQELKNDIQFIVYNQAAILYADKNQLISVFNNLIKNAQQAIEELNNGQIKVKISKRE